MLGKFLINLAVILFLSFIHVFPQPQVSQKPLEKNQIEDLVRISSSNLASETQDSLNAKDIDHRGVNFLITDEFLANLKKLGAGPKTIFSLNKIKDRQTTPAAKKYSNKLTILVARFEPHTDTETLVTDLIVSQLKDALKKYSNVNVVVSSSPISVTEGRTVALQRAKELNADIVVWGWYKKSATKVIINAHSELVLEIPNDIIKSQQNTLIDDIPNFENFSLQLNLAKEVAAISVIYLGLINFELGNFEESLRYLSNAVSTASSFPRTINLPELLILRAVTRSNQSCGMGDDSKDLLSDLDEAVSFGANPNNSRILLLRAVANLAQNPNKALEFAEKSFKNAVTDQDKTDALFLLTWLNALSPNEDETQEKEYAKKLLKHLLPQPIGFENNLYAAIASMVLDETVNAPIYLAKAETDAGSNQAKLARLYFLKGLFYWGTDSYDLAIESLKKSIKFRPSCVLTYIFLANIYKEQKDDFDSALTTINQALEFNPKMPVLYVHRGILYQSKEDYDRALSNFQKAIELEPTSTDGHRALANYFEKRGKLEDAVSSLSDLLAISTKDEDALKSRGDLYLKINKYEFAIDDYRLWFELQAKRSGERSQFDLKIFFLTIQAEFWKRSDFKNGIEFSEKYLAAFPRDEWGYKSKADFLEMKGEIDGALQVLTAAIPLFPGKTGFYKQRAALWRKKRDFERAREDLDQVIRLDKQDLDALKARADLFLEYEKLDLAIQDFKALILLEPYTSASYYHLSGIYEKQGNLKLAIENLEKAIGVEGNVSMKDIYQRRLDQLRAIKP